MQTWLQVQNIWRRVENVLQSCMRLVSRNSLSGVSDLRIDLLRVTDTSGAARTSVRHSHSTSLVDVAFVPFLVDPRPVAVLGSGTLRHEGRIFTQFFAEAHVTAACIARKFGASHSVTAGALRLPDWSCVRTCLMDAFIPGCLDWASGRAMLVTPLYPLPRFRPPLCAGVLWSMCAWA